MQALESRTYFSRREYLAMDAVAEKKHEFINGQIVAMAGANREHNLVVAELISLLRSAVGKGPCRVFPSDLRLDIGDDSFYPAVQVVCGEILPPGQSTGVTNPKVVIEVHSPSNEEYDREYKLPRYQTVESIEDIIFVDITQRTLTHHVRSSNSAFTAQSGTEAALSGVDVKLSAVFATL